MIAAGKVERCKSQVPSKAMEERLKSKMYPDKHTAQITRTEANGTTSYQLKGNSDVKSDWPV